MKRLAFALIVATSTSAYAADAPKSEQPQIQPNDLFAVTLPAAAWENLAASTDSKSLSAEIVRQIREQFAKQHPQKK